MTAPTPPPNAAASRWKRNPWWAAALLFAFAVWTFMRDTDIGATGAIVGVCVVTIPIVGLWLVVRALYRVGEPRPAPVTLAAPAGPPPGWYSNPDGDGTRWWDGAKWTEHMQQPPASA